MDDGILTELPKCYGFGINKDKLLNDWKNIIGMTLDVSSRGVIYKIDVLKNNGEKVIVKYKNKESEIDKSQLIRGGIGDIVGTFTKDYKLKIGDVLDVNTGKVRILNTSIVRNKKGYTVECLNCKYPNSDNFTYDVDEYSLMRGSGCICCTNPTNKLVVGINDFATKQPSKVKYFKNKDDAKLVSVGSNDRVLTKCLDCGFERDMIVANLSKRNFTCPVCRDSLSYPEKLFMELLKFLKIDYIHQYSPEWIGKKRYDFYIPSLNLIVETDGEFHKRGNRISNKSSESIISDDIHKDYYANLNGIKVIRVDCEFTEPKQMVNNILNSNLSSVLDLSNVDWEICNENTNYNFHKIICEYKRDNMDNTTTDIAEVFGMDRHSVLKCLKKGDKFGWCKYDYEYEKSLKYKKLVKNKQ